MCEALFSLSFIVEEVGDKVDCRILVIVLSFFLFRELQR